LCQRPHLGFWYWSLMSLDGKLSIEKREKWKMGKPTVPEVVLFQLQMPISPIWVQQEW
jgi:hypothetical protein